MEEKREIVYSCEFKYPNNRVMPKSDWLIMEIHSSLEAAVDSARYLGKIRVKDTRICKCFRVSYSDFDGKTGGVWIKRLHPIIKFKF